MYKSILFGVAYVSTVFRKPNARRSHVNMRLVLEEIEVKSQISIRPLLHRKGIWILGIKESVSDVLFEFGGAILGPNRARH